MMKKQKRPDWVPQNAGAEFTTSVNAGIESNHDGFTENPYHSSNQIIRTRKILTIDEYVNGVLQKDKVILARTITLIESNSKQHIELAQKVLKQLLPKTGSSLRIGITGVPGAGKSTFIEALGMHLIASGHKLAVLAVDPSSSITKGSVLGDKTRMEFLSRSEHCFIRPSPSGGTLGGVTRKTRETVLACEAAGYDVIFIETVGVGQNEITVRSMVDFFLLIQIAGAGDELQGIKKGVIELADAILINKADGDNITRANVAKEDFSRALHYLKSPTDGWTPQVLTCSAIENLGIIKVWELILQFRETTIGNKTFAERRKNQMNEWFHALIKERLEYLFYHNETIQKMLPELKREVLSGNIPPTEAAQKVLSLFEKNQ
jgi:LAO/AO transport system kinase